MPHQLKELFHCPLACMKSFLLIKVRQKQSLYFPWVPLLQNIPNLIWVISKPLEYLGLLLQTQPLRRACVHVWDSIFNYPGNTARCSITLAMAVIKSSKIFISIRHPHATCIINAQRKDTATFTPHTHFHHHIPSARRSQLLHVCVGVDPRNGTVDEPLRAALHGEVRGQPDCILGHHSATYSADVSGCSLTAPTLSGSVFVGETASRVCRLSCIFSVVGVLAFSSPSSTFQRCSACQYLEIPASSLSEVSEAAGCL